MNKRPAQEPQGSAFKKHKDSNQKDHQRRESPLQQKPKPDRHVQDHGKKEVDYQAAVQQLPPPTGAKAEVAAYTPFTVTKNLPPLPEISDPNLRVRSEFYEVRRYVRTPRIPGRRLLGAFRLSPNLPSFPCAPSRLAVSGS
jgi:hypothetical protein